MGNVEFIWASDEDTQQEIVLKDRLFKLLQDYCYRHKSRYGKNLATVEVYKGFSILITFEENYTIELEIMGIEKKIIVDVKENNYKYTSIIKMSLKDILKEIFIAVLEFEFDIYLSGKSFTYELDKYHKHYGELSKPVVSMAIDDFVTGKNFLF